MSKGKIQDGDGTFLGGQNSSVDPSQLPVGVFARGMNVVVRGGIAQCRPGYRCMFAFPDGEIQGLRVFTPKLGPKVMLFAVAGLVYKTEFPFRTFTQLTGIAFNPNVKQLYFQQVEESLQLNPDGSITFVEPRNLMVIQDGGFTAPAVYDGTTAAHVRGPTFIPLGGPMEWVGDRLWVARGTSLFASDIGNPTRFTENLYISGTGSFIFPFEITALNRNPATESSQLFVFTGESTALIQAGIRDRTLWITTPDFQKTIFPNVGCVSQRSVIAHYGYLYWMARFGLTSLDAAASTHITSALPYIDEPMQDSKGRLANDLTGVACATFENYLLVSVPYADQYNRHTWCLDNTALPSSPPRPTWNSFWTGTRPVEWVTDTFNNQNRIFYVSKDFDGVNRLWEAFIPDRLDDGCSITWYVETRGMNGTLAGKFKTFRYADVFVSELLGEIDIGIFWAGAHRGKYKRCSTKHIRAANGSLRSGELITADTNIFALKKQSRHLRTAEVWGDLPEQTLSSCDVELDLIESIDESFQLLIVASGPGAIRGFIGYMEPPQNDDDTGRCEKDETEENFVRFDGGASEANTFADALAQFDESDGDGINTPIYRSNRTAVVSQSGITEIGVGEAESVISQQDADKVAMQIATRRASVQLERALPLIVSVGGSF